MAISTVSTAVLVGVNGHPVRVEAHVADEGLAGFSLVGVRDTLWRELRDWVRCAVLSSGLRWPQRPITVNVAPPAGPPITTNIDLAVALAVLAADGQLPSRALVGLAALGGLGADGHLEAVAGGLSLVHDIVEPEVVVPPAMVSEIRLAGVSRTIRTAQDLSTLVRCLRGETPWPETPTDPAGASEPYVATACSDPALCGALAVSAAGGHNLLVVGPETGSGNRVIAAHLLGLLPPLSEAQVLETIRTHSAAGLGVPALALQRQRLSRHPIHDASMVSLVGGGSQAIRPGELSLAHNGVLFLDEIRSFNPAFHGNIATAAERGYICVRRAVTSTCLPTRFLAVATTKPCPCGSHEPHQCRCSPAARHRWRSRLSIPFLDTFDLRARIDNPPSRQPAATATREITEARARVQNARSRARGRGVEANSQLDPAVLDEIAPLTGPAAEDLERARHVGHLTARGTEAVRRVALTVADMAGDDPPLKTRHITAALVLHGH